MPSEGSDQTVNSQADLNLHLVHMFPCFLTLWLKMKFFFFFFQLPKTLYDSSYIKTGNLHGYGKLISFTLCIRTPCHICPKIWIRPF